MQPIDIKDQCTVSPGTEVPGGIYLCQVNDQVSCGACCGLYNLVQLSPSSLKRMLLQRAQRFSQIPRTAESIDAYARDTLHLEPQERPHAGFHHCPFIGLIGDRFQRVGCLLHPLAAGNQGVDYRGLSYYGGMACRSYFCPSTHVLDPRYKQVLKTVLRDWYHFGLIVTEHRLVTALFNRIETHLGRPLALCMLRANPRAASRLVKLLHLKCQWPFRPRNQNTPCHYFFKDARLPRSAIDYARLGFPPSTYHDILNELVTEFHTAAELRRAEQMIHLKISAVVQALQ